MFCNECGTKLDEKATFCSNCGSKVIKREDIKEQKGLYTKTIYPGNGLSIAGMVLGIVAMFFVIVCISIIPSDDFKLDMILYSGRVVAYAFGFILIPMILSLVGLPLSVSGKLKHTNGKNITGIILNTLSIVSCVIMFIYIIVNYH